MAEELLGRRARHPRRRHRPAVPAPRERGGADAGRARAPAGAGVDAQRDAPARQREDGEVRGQHPRARRGARRGRARRAGPVLRRRRTTASRSPTTASGSRPPQRACERIRDAGRRLERGASPDDLAPLRDAFFDALADDFNTAEALARVFDWIREANRREGPVGDAQLREMLEMLALDNLLEAEEGAARGARRAGASNARRPAPARTSPRRTVCATSCGPRAGRSATGPRAPSSCRRDRLRPQRGHRGAAGEAPRAADLGASRATGAARRCTQASPHDITARCGSDAHQGVCAEVEEYRYADAAELLARPEPFLVALDEVTDPQNLGAVCRTAEVAGATGVILPERRSAEVTPAVCKASAGAVEHLAIAQVRNLADFLGARQGGGVLGLRRRGRRADPVPGARLPRRRRAGARSGGQRPQAEGEGCVRRPRVAAGPRAHRLAQRERCRGGSYVRDLAATP